MTWNPLVLIPAAAIVALLWYYRHWRRAHPAPPIESNTMPRTRQIEGRHATVEWSVDGENWTPINGKLESTTITFTYTEPAHTCPDCGGEAVAGWYGGRCYRCHHERMERAPDAERLIRSALDPGQSAGVEE